MIKRELGEGIALSVFSYIWPSDVIKRREQIVTLHMLSSEVLLFFFSRTLRKLEGEQSKTKPIYQELASLYCLK